ncbi:MAG: hypothetical protein LBP22_00900 [Deltaproteobacteria bacterium]|jgi:hypothetical protein|nr:hypothetical protein [Deltaproteobacteria bacterium]
MPASQQPAQWPEPNPEAPAFWEIFKNAKNILFEYPQKLFIFLFVLNACRLIMNYGAHKLMAPMAPLLLRFSAIVQTEPELAVQELITDLTAPGSEPILFSYLGGFILPWLFLPIVFLAMCRVALGLWDNYAPSLNDLLFAFKKYPAAMGLCFYISLYFIFLAVLATLISLPVAILTSLSGEQGGPFLGLLGLVLLAFGFYYLFWPFFRRIMCLQVIPFFSYLDGLYAQYGVKAIFTHLNRFPSYLNQATAAWILALIVPAVALGLIVIQTVPEGPALEAAGFLFQLILDALLIWILIALAGFYRLCLCCRPDNTVAPASRPEISQAVQK